MKKALTALAVAALLLSSSTSYALISLLAKAEAGAGFIDPEGNGYENFFGGTQWGIGGGFELNFKLIGFSTEFIYHRDFDWSQGLKGVQADNNLRMPLMLRLYLPGIMLGVGPELAFGYIGDFYVLLNASLGSSLSLGLIKFTFELPKVSFNVWSSNKTYEIKLGVGVHFNIF